MRNRVPQLASCVGGWNRPSFEVRWHRKLSPPLTGKEDRELFLLVAPDTRRQVNSGSGRRFTLRRRRGKLEEMGREITRSVGVFRVLATRSRESRGSPGGP